MSDRYTVFGIEKPFPWLVLAWPVVAVATLIVELVK